MTREKLTFEQVIDVIRDLSYSQGFYGRLLRSIKELEASAEFDDDSYASFIELQEAWNDKFTDALDFILYIEG